MVIGIVGLGLIGGSMAKALCGYYTVYGGDLRSDIINEAIRHKIIAGKLDPDTIPECDVILLALYPRAAIRYIRENAGLIKKDSIVMDLCGVKRAPEKEILPIACEYGFHYIGSHPMAGVARVGWESSSGDLFEGASMILVPHADTTFDVLETVKELSARAGFTNIAISNADEHDRMIAYTSQLAHVLSSAYVKTPAAARHRGFSAGSFRDMTRVAWLNEDMWTELFMDNPDYLVDEIEGLASRLLEYSAAIRSGNDEKLHELLRDGRLRKEELEERE